MTLEYLPSLDRLTPDFCEASRKALLELCAWSITRSIPTHGGAIFHKTPSRTRNRNVEKTLTPPSSILGLLADGCELRLGARIEIHDFATNTTVSFQGASAQHTGPKRIYPGAPRRPRRWHAALLPARPKRTCGQG